MNNRRYFLLTFLAIICSHSFSQGILITKPELRADGEVIIISYDIISRLNNDIFYIWVEITRTDGRVIHPTRLTGDIGEKIKAGQNKEIRWDISNDTISLNEEISVEVKGEKYVKSFTRAGVLARSLVLPGWGHTVAKPGKPWWIAGIAAYGSLSGGFYHHRKYLQNYKLYHEQRSSADLRAEYYEKAQKEDNLSREFFYGAAAIWTADLIWTAVLPDNFMPLKNGNISLTPSFDYFTTIPFITFRMEF